MIIKEIEPRYISKDTSIKDVIKIFNDTQGIVLIKEENKIIGIITFGDLRRSIHSNPQLTISANEIMNSSFMSIKIKNNKDILEEYKKVDTPYIISIAEDGSLNKLFYVENEEEKHYDISKIIITQKTTLKDTIKIIDKSGLGIGVIVNDNKEVLGVVTDKDIRTALLSGHDISESIDLVMNTSPLVAYEDEDKAEVSNRITITDKSRKTKIPILNRNNQIVDLFSFENMPNKIVLEYKSKSDDKPVENILLIGGAGYLGSILTELLLERGYKVTVLDKLVYDSKSLDQFSDNVNFRLIVGDTRHIEDITNAIINIDAVIHLAGLVGDEACALDPKKTLDLNFLSTFTVAQICKKYQINRFIFASSCSVYGFSKNISDENSTPNPLSLYARDKLYSEKALLELSDDNFSPTIMRMGTLYGASHRPRFDLVVNILAAHATVNNKFKIFGGDQWRPLVHVRDAAKAYILALEAPLNTVKNQIFNLGSDDQNLQIKDLGEYVLKNIPDAEMQIVVEEQDRRDYRINFSKIKNILNYNREYSIADGVKEIKELLESKKVLDFTDKKYNNFKYIGEVNEYLI